MSRQRVGFWPLRLRWSRCGALLIGGATHIATLLGVTLAVTLAVGWSSLGARVIAACIGPAAERACDDGVGFAWFARAIGR